MNTSLDEVIAAERIRLTEERDTLTSQRVNIDTKLGDIDRRFAAIMAYETTLTPPQVTIRRRTGNGSNGTTPPAAEPTRREAIVALLKEETAGMTRGEILTKLGVAGNKAQSASISTALSNLKKAAKVNNDNGRYTLIA